MYEIRLAVRSDLSCLVNIYNQAIALKSVTADTTPFSEEERIPWFEKHSPDVHPIYVCEIGHAVVGYLSVSSYRERPALARTGEVSYYVDTAWQSKGVGSALLQYALSDALRIDKSIYLAIVLEGNTASMRLLEKYGFDRWGYLPEVADFDGILCSQIYYGRQINKAM
jgi:L-amino acid N-acyltransferase YncA